MNKNGFTLIELIGSVVILAILALVAFPAILSVLNSGQDQVDGYVKDVITSATEEFVNDNVGNYPKSSSLNTNVLVEELWQNGYIDDTFYKKYCEMQDDSVNVKSNNGNYVFTYVSNPTNSDCES